MGELFVYILKSSLCLAAFYLFFKLMLSRETLYRFNRIVLLTLLFLSLAIPFIRLSFEKELPYSGLALNIDALMAMAGNIDTTAAPEVNNLDVWMQWIFILYLIGVVFFLGRSIYSIIRIAGLIRMKGSNRFETEGVMIVIHNREIAPFSWMRYVVISEKDYQESGREILIHELAHIHGRHSLDMILAELVSIIHWFNPSAYLLKLELKNIHEYQADEAVIKKGIDAKQYQILLIKKAVGDRLYTMANSFNHSKLKNRITMISKKKSNSMAALKALFVLPLTAFAVVAFASEEVTSKMEVISNAKITEIFAQDTIKKVAKVKVNSEEGKVKGERTYSVTVNDVNQGQASTKKVITYMVRDTVNVSIVGYDTTKRGFRHDVISIRESGSKDSVCTFMTYMNDNNKDATPLCIVDGKEVDLKVMKALNPGAIHSISVLKDKAAIDIYGEKGKNGVLVVTLKSVSVDWSNDDKNKSTIIIRGAKDNHDVLYVVDGKVMDFKDAMEINPEQIKSLSILKGDVAKAKYGDKVKKSVIEIKLK